MTRVLRAVIAGSALAAALTTAGAAAQAPAEKTAIVAVSGCLIERGANTWALTDATEPTPSNANGPAPNAPMTGPATGKSEFALIGVREFNLPAHKGHTVLVKALFIKAAPVSRLNVTSVTHIAPTCPPSAK